MGTNYYLYERPPCPVCGHQAEPLHIGKSSAGWVFALHVIPDLGLATLDAWIERWTPRTSIAGVTYRPEIRDEYGASLSAENMLKQITERSWLTQYPWTDADYTRNDAVRGPCGLSRSALGPHCCGHGEGTWDYHEEEFS